MSTEWSVRVAGLMQFALEGALAEVSAEVAPRHPDLRLAHVQILRWGSLDTVRVTELAARARMTKQSMHELTSHLELHGYVRREPDPADSRALRVRLTARGRELESQYRAASARVHLRWLDRLGDKRFAELWSALQDITGRADPLPDSVALAHEADKTPAPVQV
jgi:DNA-binding MarR family transcriptional regulator